MQQPRSKTRNGPGTTNTGPTGTTNEKPKIGLVKSESGVSPPNASPPKTNLPLADSGHQTYGSLFWISIPLGSKKGQLMPQKLSEFGCGDGMGAARMRDTAGSRPQARGCDLARGVAMRCQKGGVVPGLGGARHRPSETRPQKSNNPTADGSRHETGCGHARPPKTMPLGDS